MYLFYMGSNPKKVLLNVSESAFSADEADAIRDSGHSITWSKTESTWIMDVRLAEINIKELSQYGEISVSQKVEDAINEYKRNLSTFHLAKGRVRYNQDYMKFPCLVGKDKNRYFQLEDLLKALNQNRFVFGHDTGLGKSWTLTALMGHLYKLGLVKRFVVCSSNIGVGNVADEIVFHSTIFKKEDIKVITSVESLSREERLLFNEDNNPQAIIVCTYDVIKAAGFAYYDKAHATKNNPHPSDVKDITSVPWDDEVKKWFGIDEGFNGCFMADEAHTINIATSKRSKICKKLFELCEYRYLFSGTMADKVEKLYMIGSLTDPYLTGGLTYHEWLDAHNKLGTKTSKYMPNAMTWDVDYFAWLNQQLATIYGSKRNFDDCLETKEAIRLDPIRVEMKPLHREIYEMASNETLAEYQQNAEAQGKTLSIVASPTHFQAMHMAVDNPACLIGSKVSENFSPYLKDKIKEFADKGIEGLSKWDTLMSIMDRHYFSKDGDKGIVWCFHPITREMLVKGLEAKGVKVFTVSSEMDSDKRVPYLKEEFLAYPDKAVLVAPITLVNSSVTMVECSWEFYFEKVYSYKDYKQSLGRIHRATKTKVSYTYSALYNRSIDFLQESNLQQKGNLLNGLMNMKFISGDKWRSLFNLDNVIDVL